MTLPVPGADAAVRGAASRVGGNLPTRAKPSSVDKHFGLTVWFRVKVTDAGTTRELGEWSKCGGLGITLKPEEFRQGGSPAELIRVPGDVSFSSISLERAMERTSSKNVRDWLQSVVDGWSGTNGATPKPSTVIVELYGAYKGDPIATWELRNAVPVGWSGPALSAEGGGIAKETLTIAHDGFLDPGKSEPYIKLEMLASTESDDVVEEPILFPYNPAKIKLQKTNTIKTASTGQSGDGKDKKPTEERVYFREDQVVDPGKLSVTISDLRIEGAKNVVKIVDTLYRWLIACERSAVHWRLTVGNHVTIGAHRSAIPRRVLLKSVTADYTRFTADGQPSRAQVNLTLEQAYAVARSTNPTSHAIDNGSLHTVVAGDSLQSVALDHYGSASAWRHVAEANGIDDPMRVRNGSTLLLTDKG